MLSLHANKRQAEAERAACLTRNPEDTVEAGPLLTDEMIAELSGFTTLVLKDELQRRARMARQSQRNREAAP